MTNASLTLVSHSLCPYVQRAVISLTEKAVPFGRIDVDLANKPDWFLAISPLAKTPVLKVGERAIFESAVILEYLEETQPTPLHPADPLTRAEHRAWIEFGSGVLDDIWGFYIAPDEVSFNTKTKALATKFEQIERRLGDGPYFDGARFSLVDTVFAPVFRYFDVFDQIGEFKVFCDKPKVAAWRQALASRPSVEGAVGKDYDDRLWAFLVTRKSHLSALMASGRVSQISQQRQTHGGRSSILVDAPAAKPIEHEVSRVCGRQSATARPARTGGRRRR